MTVIEIDCRIKCENPLAIINYFSLGLLYLFESILILSPCFLLPDAKADFNKENRFIKYLN